METSYIFLHHGWSSGGYSSVLERLVSDRKVAEPRFDYRTGNTLLLCHWEKHFTQISHSDQPVYAIWCLILSKDLQTEPLKRCSALVWLGRSRVSSSYEQIKTGLNLNDKYVEIQKQTFLNFLQIHFFKNFELLQMAFFIFYKVKRKT